MIQKRNFWVLKIFTESIALFFASTFITHLLMFNIQGDYVASMAISSGVSETDLVTLREEMGTTNLFSSYIHVLTNTGHSLYNLFTITSDDYEKVVSDHFPVLLYVFPTMIISVCSLLVYIFFTASIVFFNPERRTHIFLKNAFVLIISIGACIPIFAMSRFLSKWTIFSFHHVLTWESLFNASGSIAWISIPIIFCWSYLQGLGDGAFVEGARGLKEEYVKLQNQPYILFQKVNSGTVKRHLIKGMLPYICSISYFRFIQLLGGTVIVEYIFNIKGLGWYLVQSVKNRDFIDIFHITFLTMLCVSVASSIHQFIIAKIDPRYQDEIY